ncbi:MAG: hypothetical protein R6U57_03810 [Anaerolineales bacterium]
MGGLRKKRLPVLFRTGDCFLQLFLWGAFIKKLLAAGFVDLFGAKCIGKKDLPRLIWRAAR